MGFLFIILYVTDSIIKIILFKLTTFHKLKRLLKTLGINSKLILIYLIKVAKNFQLSNINLFVYEN